MQPLTLPGPFDPHEQAGRWRLAVADEDVPQHAWFLAPLGALPPPMIAREGEFDPDWGPLWRTWQHPEQGKVDIWMEETAPIGGVLVLPEPRRVEPSDIGVQLTVSPAFFAPKITTKLAPGRVLYRLGIQSARNDWRIVIYRAFTRIVAGTATIVLEYDPASGDLYTLVLAQHPETR